MRVYGRVVNLYNGGYSVDGDSIKFDGFSSTMMMGEPEAMEIEQEYFQFMPTVEKYELSDGKLTLIATDGVFSCLLFINMFYNMLITYNQAKEKT